MTRQDAVVARVQSESEALAGMIRLASSSDEYAEVVRAVLDLIEPLAHRPLLCLSIQEGADVGHYARAQPGIDLDWAEAASQTIAGVHEEWLGTGGADQRVPEASLEGEIPWFRSFPTWTRAGRAGVLAVATNELLVLSADDVLCLRRLSEAMVLVLDHALLLEQVDQLETIDRLTGVTNYRRLLEILDYELQRHRHTGRDLGLLLLDVEGLEVINRSYGRQYGNHILRRLATLIGEVMRPIDVVARTGHDEFVVLLPETGEDAAQGWLERLRACLLSIEFAGGEVWLSAAAVQAAPVEMLSPERLLHRAEVTLAAAKRQQRGWTSFLDGRATAGKPGRRGGG